MIISCGEALIDMLPRKSEAGEEAFAPYAGGAVFNTAIALGRLGVPSGFFTGLSSDMFGDVLHECRAPSEGVVICIRHLARVEPMDALATLAPDAGEPED